MGTKFKMPEIFDAPPPGVDDGRLDPDVPLVDGTAPTRRVPHARNEDAEVRSS